MPGTFDVDAEVDVAVGYVLVDLGITPDNLSFSPLASPWGRSTA